MSGLNEEGRNKLIEFADILKASKKFSPALVEFTYWKPEKWTFKSKRRLRKYELTFDKHEQRAWNKLN